MSDTHLELKVDGAVATATFKTESGLNALSSKVLDEIARVADEVRVADGVRFLILAAEGKVFLAGANIKELSGLDVSGATELSRRGNRAFDAIADLPCVTIARLHGSSLGGGLELAMACDFRIAVGDAKVGLPEASLGLIPGWKGLSRMIKLAGMQTTRCLAYGGVLITAQQARKQGIIDDVADDEAGVDKKIKELMEEIHRGSPHAIAQIKRAIRSGDETAAFAECFSHDESREGITAFLEKRPAQWMKG